MRNFEERKEEIFRRSEERIARRKKNMKRIDVTCVPLVLCVSVASGYLLLGGFGMNSASPEANMNPNYGMIADAQESICDGRVEAEGCVPESNFSALAPGSLAIGSGALYYGYADPDAVDMFLGMLEAPEHVLENAGDADNKTYGSGEVTGGKIIDDEPYNVVLTNPDGTQVWYTLRGNQLTRQDGATYTLTDEQVQWLVGLMEETP